MNSIVKAFLFGFLSWLIPFISSFPFYSKEAGLLIDVFLFKSIMIIVGAVTGAFLMVLYFKNVNKKYLKEGLLLGLIWFVLNIGLDMLVLVPMAKITISSYFMGIGIRYLVIPIFSITIGYLLEVKL